MIKIVNHQLSINNQKGGGFMTEDFEPIIIAFCCNF